MSSAVNIEVLDSGNKALRKKWETVGRDIASRLADILPFKIRDIVITFTGGSTPHRHAMMIMWVRIDGINSHSVSLPLTVYLTRKKTPGTVPWASWNESYSYYVDELEHVKTWNDLPERFVERVVNMINFYQLPLKDDAVDSDFNLDENTVRKIVRESDDASKVPEIEFEGSHTFWGMHKRRVTAVLNHLAENILPFEVSLFKVHFYNFGRLGVKCFRLKIFGRNAVQREDNSDVIVLSLFVRLGKEEHQARDIPTSLDDIAEAETFNDLPAGLQEDLIHALNEVGSELVFKDSVIDPNFSLDESVNVSPSQTLEIKILPGNKAIQKKREAVGASLAKKLVDLIPVDIKSCGLYFTKYNITWNLPVRSLYREAVSIYFFERTDVTPLKFTIVFVDPGFSLRHEYNELHMHEVVDARTYEDLPEKIKENIERLIMTYDLPIRDDLIDPDFDLDEGLRFYIRSLL